MQQLTELDYSFVQMENHRTPMHISPVLFYDQSGIKGGRVRFKEILTVFERNLHKSKVFRRKLSGGTMGIDTPYWIEDEGFDLEFHVRHIALPKPGDWRQLCILLARLQSRGLDMSRPLWEAYVIEGLDKVEGLPGDSFAIMLKIHHAAIDGVSAAEIIGALHSLDNTRMPPEVPDDWQGESAPSPMTIWSRAYVNNLKRPLRLAEAAGKLVPRALRAWSEEEAEAKAEKAGVPRTPFNARVSSHRVTDALILDLAEIKKIKSSAQATINDVIISVVSGGMRKYLLAKDQLPDSSMICGAPINVRVERNSDSRGNQVGFMTIDMASDVEDAMERLQAVARHTDESKAYSSAVGATAIMDITKGLWPQFTGAAFRVASLAALTSDFSIPLNTIVSNVPGPQQPLYLAGAKVHMMMGVGPLTDMMGLFHSVISGAGKISINFVACRQLLPDPDVYRDCLQQAYDELRDAALPRPKAKASRSRRKTSRRKNPST